MKKTAMIAASACLLALSSAAEDPVWKSGSVRACWFRANISCKVGDLLWGYGQKDVSLEKLDDLEACGLCIDDGGRGGPVSRLHRPAAFQPAGRLQAVQVDQLPAVGGPGAA